MNETIESAADQFAKEGKAFLDQGEKDQAKASFSRALAADPKHEYALSALGTIAIQDGRADDAIRYFTRLVNANPQSADMMIALGMAYETANDFKTASDCFHKALKLDGSQLIALMLYGMTQMEMGQVDHGAQLISRAFEADPDLPLIGRSKATPIILRGRIQYAEAALHSYLTKRHKKSVKKTAERFEGADLSRIENAVWLHALIEKLPYKDSRQRPWLFYLPGVKPKMVFERSRFRWAPEVEFLIPALRDEVLGAIDILRDAPTGASAKIGLAAEGEGMVRDKWRTLHLHRNASPMDEVLAQFPVAKKLLDTAAVARLRGKPVEAYLSLVQAHGRIPKHCAPVNSHITIHVPISIPDGAVLRVGGDELAYHESKLLAFDESFEHELENKSDEDCIYLAFTVWHPSLSEAERAAVEASFVARQNWMDERVTTV
ncbi:MAG: aspartyl/asparaginyl beta-hydroxylase domain-containing protein [Pseudomonadota bacterium]